MLRYLTICVLSLGMLWGQAQSDVRSVLTLEAVPPPAIDSGQIGAVITGTPGRTTYYYWVVTNYNIGSSLPGGPAIVYNGPDALSGANFITLYWPHKLYAISYDLLRTATPAFPGGTNTIAVATGLTGYSQVDNGGALGAYTLASANKATGHIRLDNIQSIRPTLFMYPFDMVLDGDLNMSGGISAGGDIDGDDIGADGQVSAPIICIVGGVCVNSVNQIQGIVPQYSIAWASHDNQLEGDIGLFRVDVGFGGITLDGTLTYVSALAFAALVGQANGTTAYCDDCTIANPCAGAGTGAIAKKLGGVWVCN